MIKWLYHEVILIGLIFTEQNGWYTRLPHKKTSTLNKQIALINARQYVKFGANYTLRK